MFIPLSDGNPLRYLHFQYATVLLIALNTAVFFGLQGGGLTANEASALGFGFIPAVLGGTAALSPQFVVVPSEATLVTYMFFHADWLHLGTNMLFLWVFGDNVEDALGHVRFLAFYLLCGIAGALAHYVLAPTSEMPLIGASGAVAGIISAYLMLHPRVRVWVLALGRIPLRLSAIWLLGAWIVLQLVNAVSLAGEDVAWWAHVGGLAAGAVLILVMRRPGVPLFDRGLVGT